MMKSILFTLAFLSISGMAQSQENTPKIIVGIVVDQMRSDYLFRFEDQYGEGGFKRLMREGFYAANHQFSYMPTTTGPGHASVYTGTTPAVHGIAGNNWYDPMTKEGMYCAQDKSVKTVGAQDASGQMSPRNLRTSTITDELKVFSNYKSKVIGVSLKDRGAILPAGHIPDGAYWLSDGNFITSSYYMDELPSWVEDFNDQDLVSDYLKEGWKTLLPIEQYTSSLPDDNPYESVMADEKGPVFPRSLKKLAKTNGGRDIIKCTPFGNTLVMEFAKAAIESEALGEDEITDFLAVSFSSTDYMGHAYGPRAIETQDTYLRLDADIAVFLTYMDQKFGPNNYTVFLTADHGASEVGQYSVDRNLPGGNLMADSLRTLAKATLESIHPSGVKLIEKIEGNRVYWDRDKVKEAGLNLDELSSEFADALTYFPGIYAAYPTKIILWGSATEFPMRNLKRGLYPSLAGDVVWILDSGVINYGMTGTTHGSPWMYDNHVPLIMFGNGVKPGKTMRETNIRDIAPTLSMMFNIPLPSGTTGSPIVEGIQD